MSSSKVRMQYHLKPSRRKGSGAMAKTMIHGPRPLTTKPIKKFDRMAAKIILLYNTRQNCPPDSVFVMKTYISRYFFRTVSKEKYKAVTGRTIGCNVEKHRAMVA